ncbi:MAG: hypothetical protein AAF823_10455 [Planctomycetota bacterium]
MNFSTDRDLLALDAAVFADLPFAAQQRLRITDGQLDGTTLLTVEGDFAAALVTAGSVVLVDRTPYEVIERTDATTLSVSQLRARLADPLIPAPGPAASDLTVVARTFEPQAALVHAALLRLLGIDPDDPAAALTEEAVLSLTLMARLEALGTLELAYASAATTQGDNDELRRKADHYRHRFQRELRAACVLIDTTGNGLPDETRRPGTLRLTRA